MIGEGPAAPYRAVAANGEAELREKGSRFLALVVPAGDEAEAARRRAEIERRHADATHVCWAWRLGSPARGRSSDAGEPAGTAGQPMLRVLEGAGVSDALAVVVRWYGGTKLGKGGLARAYAAATREALAAAEVAWRLPRRAFRLRLPYDRLGTVQRLVHPPEVEVLEESYGELVTLRLAVAEERLAAVSEAAAALGVELLADGDAPAGRRPT